MSSESNAEQASETAVTKPCRYCAKDIPAKALVCTECNNWQNWRGQFQLSPTLLSLVLAILTVTFTSGRDFYMFLTAKPKVEAVVSYLSFSGETNVTPEDLEMSFVNNEDRNVIVDGSVWCDAKNVDSGVGGLKIHFLYLFQPDGSPALGRVFLIPSKATLKVKLNTIEYSRDNVAKVLVPAAKILLECKVKVRADGTEHELGTNGTAIVM
jgi:hypothetical protein